jgi:predicted nucleic acid-binding protein
MLRLTMPVVIDASALVELLLRRERWPAVVQAVGDTQMVAPDVINAEVLSAFRRRELRGELRADRGRAAVEDLLDAPVRRFPTLPLLPAAWALRASVTAYDACYIALARDLACPLVTADRKLSGVPRLGVPLITV